MATSGWPRATRRPQTGWNQNVDDWDSWRITATSPPTNQKVHELSCIWKLSALSLKTLPWKLLGSSYFFFFECELPILLDWHPYFGAKTTIKSLALWDFPGGPLQGTWVQSLVREDPTCHGATKPSCSRAWVLQQEKAPKWEAHTSKLDSGPHLQQWEKAQAQQERPSTTKKKERKSLALCEVGTLTLLGYNMVIAFITLPKRTLPYTFQ